MVSLGGVSFQQGRTKPRSSRAPRSGSEVLSPGQVWKDWLEGKSPFRILTWRTRSTSGPELPIHGCGGCPCRPPGTCLLPPVMLILTPDSQQVEDGTQENPSIFL